MKRLLSVSVTAGTDATGRIALQTCQGALVAGMETLLAYGRGSGTAALPCFSIASRSHTLIHGIATRLLDRHGLESATPTRRLITQIERYRPDVIHLHNIHGYYLNYPMLFRFLADTGIPTVWTIHDCWPLTGHCACFNACRKWKDGCRDFCPERKAYPCSFIYSAAERNFSLKQHYFNLPGLNLHLVGVSEWTSDMVRKSMLKDHPIITILNGVDTSVFSPEARTSADDGRPVLLGVARRWLERKGLSDFIRLSEVLDDRWRIRLVGITDAIKRKLPARIETVPFIADQLQLASEFASATVFANLTYADTCGLTQLEALACGTPVVVYDSGGAPESVIPSCGRVIAAGSDAVTTARSIEEAALLQRNDCRNHAIECYSVRAMQKAYLNLYSRITNP